ncbi:hypothetical protein H310_05570 [Aphanomyces invadans]|uniref:Uncharacterized protein n=1 Tax=Aphanomyces invadans TaxID=157072 RepID=A0A024U9P1_9STRA|nr:hypothetical protein H310_05570 [Aphanomyces invadans]ETW03151.1 hypothetical protein H310_05570 [Aphanomyces invadans]|eukprot:XP_008868535.1 hypothetical protein H310_05570 [Aphanomyces invadans]
MFKPPPPPLAPAAMASDELIRLRIENAMLMSQLRIQRQENARLREELKNAHGYTATLDFGRLKQQVAAAKRELARTTAKLPQSLRERRLLRDYRLYLSTNPPDDMLAMCAKALRGNLRRGMFIYDLVLTQLQFFASSSSTFPGRACTKFPPKIVHWCESMYMTYGRRAYELLSGEAKASSIGDKRSPSTWSGHMVLPSLRMIQRRLAAFRAQHGLSSDIVAANYVSNKELLKRMAPPADTSSPPTTQEHLCWAAALVESYMQCAVPTEAMYDDLDDILAFLTSVLVNEPSLLDLLRQRQQRQPTENVEIVWRSMCASVLRILESADVDSR